MSRGRRSSWRASRPEESARGRNRRSRNSVGYGLHGGGAQSVRERVCRRPLSRPARREARWRARTDIVGRLPAHTMSGWSIAVRTVVIDELIQTALRGGVDTVLNLGAGLDTRPAHRMDLPRDLRWIEVDYAPMIEFKEWAPGVRNWRRDLRRARSHGSSPMSPARRALFADIAARSSSTLVLTEGVVPYLSVQDVGALADDPRGLGAAHAWIDEYFSEGGPASSQEDGLRVRERAIQVRARRLDFSLLRRTGMAPERAALPHARGRSPAPADTASADDAPVGADRPAASRRRRSAKRCAGSPGYFVLEPI